MRFFFPSKKKNNAQVRETLPNTSLSVWTAGPNHEWDSMQAWLGGGQGEPPHIAGCGDCRSTSRGSHGGWRWPGIRTGLTLQCFRYSINLSTSGNHRGRVEKEPVWVQQNFTRQFQQDAAAYISNLSPAEQREFQTGHVESEQSAGKFIDCVLWGEPWALWEEILQNKGKRKHHSKDSEEEQASEMNLL